MGEDRVPALQGVRQPGEGAQVRHHARHAAEGTRLVLRSRLIEEGRASFCCMHNYQLIVFIHVNERIYGVQNVWMRIEV